MVIFLSVIGTVLVLGLVVVGFVTRVYNILVKLRYRFQNAFSQIDVQLKRRHDLIPNLVEATKGYLTHEHDTLEAVISARNQAASATGQAASKVGDAGAMGAMLGAETVLSGAIGRLFAVVESYPELKANETIHGLMEEISSTENKIAFARQAYNDSVMLYNTRCETFPNVMFADVLGFKPATMFETDDEAVHEAPKVSLS